MFDIEPYKELLDYGVPLFLLVFFVVIVLRLFLWYFKPIREEEVKSRIIIRNEEIETNKQQRKFLEGLERHEERRHDLCEKHVQAIHKAADAVGELKIPVFDTNEQICVFRQMALGHSQLLRIVVNSGGILPEDRDKLITILDDMETSLVNYK